MDVSKSIFDVQTHASGPMGSLPLQPDFLSNATSGHVFGWTQDAAMGWSPSDLGKDEYLIHSTQGGIRAEDGSPIALGYHTGHYEVGRLAQTATMKRALPELAGYLTRDLDFPQGVFLMTGICLVPADNFTLQQNDVVLIQVGELVIENQMHI